MPRYVYLLLVLLVAMSSQCTPDGSSTDATAEEAPDEAALPSPTIVKPTYVTPDAFAVQLDTLLSKYITLKDGFVRTDTTTVNASADAFLTHLQQITSDNLPTDAQSKWLEYKKMLERSVQTVRASSRMEEKRNTFEDISKEIYALINDFGAKTTLYKQYCPMAHQSKGAYWLSVHQEIRNPYFGDLMLECGEVQEVLTFEE